MKKDSLGCKIGDCVVVRKGVADADSGVEMSGWQGRVTEIREEEDQTLLCVSWDSLTLKNMPRSYLEESEEEGLDWESYYLEVGDAEKAQSRDTPGEVARAVDEIAAQVRWHSLGEEGKRIQKVLGGASDEWEALKAWERYIEKNARFPFDAEVSEPQDRGRLRVGDKVDVLNLSGLDDLYGIIVAIKRGSEGFDFPLCDLEVVGRKSPNKEIVADYAVWFANR